MPEPAVCPSCQTAFEPQDIFCGNCRRPRAAFFTHAQAESSATASGTPAPPGGMNDITRYLCAAAYLDPSFAGSVLGEFLGSRRAVVPSHGFDLVPIVRHCLKARRMRLVRDVLLTLISIPFYLAFWFVLLLIAAITLWLSQWIGPRWRRPSFVIKVAVAATAIWAVVVFAFAVVVNVVLAVTSLGSAGDYGGGYDSAYGGSAYGGSPVDNVLAVLTLFLVAFLIYVGLFAAVVVLYYLARNRALRKWLGFGAPPPPWRASSWAQARMADISVAQHGNLTVYGGEDPFLGAGVTPLGWRSGGSVVSGGGERAWSIAIELNRGENGSRPGPGHIDAVDVHTVLRERLLELNDHPGLSLSERIDGVSVDDFVVGEGQFPLSAPLVDPERLVPYSRVSPEAIAALKRSPQAGLRCYQRVSIRDKGQDVLAGDRPVIGAVDQEVVVSAFVYVAVEGGMFYLQFVPTSLAPVRDAFRVVNYLPNLSSSAFAVKVVADAARGGFSDVLTAPVGLFRTLGQLWRESQAAAGNGGGVLGTAYTDIGARISVRQLGAQPHPRTYIQQLDVAKYTQILERLVLETVLDFLNEREIDTGAYRSSMQAIYNSGVIVGGNITGSTLTVSGEGRK